MSSSASPSGELALKEPPGSEHTAQTTVPLEGLVLKRVLTFLTWRELLGIRRVSKSWMNAVNDCLATYTRLDIGRFEFPPKLHDTQMELLLAAMPSLRSLSVEWRLDRDKLDVDIISDYCQNLVEVDLTRFRLDAWSLEQLCHACPKLEAVKLPRKCDDECAEVLLRNLPCLRSLDLAQTNVSGKFLTWHIESVTQRPLSGCRNFRLEQLRRDSSSETEAKCEERRRWSHLRELDLSSTAITPADVSKIFKNFPELESVSFAHCEGIHSNSLLQMTLCAGLQEIDFSSVGPLQAIDLFTMMIRCPQLRRLVLAGCEIQETARLSILDMFSAKLCLQELDVTSVRGLTISNLAGIISCSPDLQSLHAAGFDDMELTVCLRQLKKCPALRELDLSRPGVDKIRKRVDSGVLSSVLQSCQKLERLFLAGCHITEGVSLRHLACCSGLRELNLSYSDGVVPSELVLGLSGCPRLERLSLAGHRAPLEQLIPPQGLQNLLYLDFSKGGLTNNSLRRLRRLCLALQTLNMSNCTGVNAGSLVAYLPRLQQLRFLDLRGVPEMTTVLLDKLKESRLSGLRLDLRTLDMSKVTARSVAELVLDCPTLNFVWMDHPWSIASEMLDIITERKSPDRSIVICTMKSELDPSPEGYRSMCLPQLGSLWKVDADTVQWGN